MAVNILLERFIEIYPGSSFPTLCEVMDGTRRVLKMRGAGNGSESLLSEYIVNRITAAAGLNVPDATIIGLPEAWPWEFGTDEFYDIVRKSSGPNLGLDVVESAAPIPAALYNKLPQDFVSQVVTIDLIFGNLDRSTRSGNLLQTRKGANWIIDHGSCRFLFRRSDGVTTTLCTDHIFAGWEGTFNRAWLSSVTRAKVVSIVDEIPELWLTESQLTKEMILGRLGALEMGWGG